MSFEIVMGMYISDKEEYQRYREAMTPILTSYGGSFGFDFTVSEVLISKTDDPINRVFTLEFPSRKIMDEFFSNSDYLSIKKQHFSDSVTSRTVISMHEKLDIDGF